MIRISQEQETSIQAGGDVFSYRYAYVRAKESRDAGDKGQDYLVFSEDGTSLCFALCDGVSLSFFGDLAASFLGDKLVQWLSTADISDEKIVETNLTAYLTELTAKATNEVEQFRIPAKVPPIVRVVLEEKRGLGSESMFVCGRIDLQAKMACFAWMGDIRLRLWKHGEECSELLGKSFATNQRWSTRHGLRNGKLHVKRFSLEELTFLQAYTDGLAICDHCKYIPNNQKLQQLIELSQQRADSDDVAILDVSWGG